MKQAYRQSQFDNLESKEVRKSQFDLSHEFKTQMCFGRYYPILCEETLPGDEWYIDGEYMFRFPSMYFPIQQIATMRADWWFCPNRILFKGTDSGSDSYQKEGWIGFIQGEDIELPITNLNINGAGWGGSSAQQIYPGCSYPIENYLGFPMDNTARLDGDKQRYILGSAFPLAMYLMCYDEGYRNPLWEEPVFFNLTEGNTNTNKFNAVVQTVGSYQLLSWADTLTSNVINHPPFFALYQKDYFTSARPEPQEGEAIRIPMLGEEYPMRQVLRDGDTGAIVPNAAAIETDAQGELSFTNESIIDMTGSAASIRQLRIAQVLQQFHERVMRIGKRYRQYIKGLWGNDPEPSVIDTPVLIGSHFGRIQVSDTLTTANTETGETGNYKGNMNFHNMGTGHNYFCQEHGQIMCILNIMPNTAYQQGIHPMWTREVNTDFALDIFAGIGDQEIKRKELLILNIDTLWADPTEPENAVIGYQDRFAEYKTRVNRIFNTNDLYDANYMGQKLTPVEANYTAIGIEGITHGISSEIGSGIREADIFNALPYESGVSTYTDATIFAHMYFTLKVKRALPYFSTPGKMIV